MSTPTKTPPDDTMIAHMAQVFQIMGDETRLKILRCLMCGAMTVSEIVTSTGQSQANVSKHLALLTRFGLLERRKQGTRVWYSILDPIVHALCEAVCQHKPADLPLAAKPLESELKTP